MKCRNCRNLVKRIDGDGTLYDFCGMVIDSPDTDRERNCKYYVAATNADRIRAMSDEELAMWINDVTTNALSVLALGSNKQTKTLFYWLEWLKQEAENG